jgi:tRNA/rRNA methyltransferase
MLKLPPELATQPAVPPLMGPLERLRVVLVAPQEPGNVGAAARAMRNFGLSRLWLVNPLPRVLEDLRDPHSQALRMAVHAEEILRGCTVVDTLDRALEGTALVVGTTGRPREIYPAPLCTPREAALSIAQVARRQEVALVFGRETFGLTNDELDASSLIVQIPTAPEQPSLNLAQAVLLLAYEVFLALAAPPRSQPARASYEAMKGLFEDLEAYLLEVGFTDSHRLPYARRRIQRILQKAELTPGEVQILRGLLHQSRWYRNKPDDS